MRRGMALTGLLWLGLMLGIIGSYEFTLHTGREVVLQTVPVDPRDLFRGDYVVLSYGANTLDLTSLPNDVERLVHGQTVYVALNTNGPHAAPVAVSAARPSGDAAFLKGRVEWASGRQIRVTYGLESFFVPEGKGRTLERARGKSLEVIAVVDRSGRAVIKALRLNGVPVTFR